MKNIIKQKIFLICIIFIASGCASIYTPPRKWLEQPVKLQTNTYGGWIIIESRDDRWFTGELIAVSTDSIFIASERLLSIAKSDVTSARLIAYKSNSGMMGTLVLLGTLSTYFNGIFIVYTFPMWIIGGSIILIRRLCEPIIDYPKHKWDSFAKFARYPQGLPIDIDRSQIRIKRNY